ncbi:hypothetical protein D3C79_340470 [compost metagenome]
MADHRRNLVLIDQTVGDRHRLLRFAGVVTLHQFDFFPFDPTGSVDIRRRLRSTAPVLIAIGRIRPGERPGNADDDIGLSIKSRT